MCLRAKFLFFTMIVPLYFYGCVTTTSRTTTIEITTAASSGQPVEASGNREAFSTLLQGFFTWSLEKSLHVKKIFQSSLYNGLTINRFGEVLVCWTHLA